MILFTQTVGERPISPRKAENFPFLSKPTNSFIVGLNQDQNLIKKDIKKGKSFVRNCCP